MKIVWNYILIVVLILGIIVSYLSYIQDMKMNKMEEETSDSLSRQIYLPEDSLDGTYLICDSSDVWGFKFKDKKVFGYTIEIRKDKAIIENRTPSEAKSKVVSITTDYVEWWSMGFRSEYILNRETLILQRRYINPNDRSINRKFSITGTWQCEVQPDDLTYNAKIEEHRKNLQITLDKEISARTEKNKI